MNTAMSYLKSLLFYSDDTANLPPRVREAVAAQQDQSERLIGWVQLSLVLIFALLYTIAPKTHMDTFFTSPVPITLVLYFLFTVLRLVMSYRLSLPDWYLGLSGLMDIALLMVLIWSFHLQYEQPAPFYLKAPTMLYVFIFIALRALRFQPRYVLRTGLAAALGWSLMAAYAIHSEGYDAAITRDYVVYLTDNRVLLGGELDKILSILIVTVLLTVAQIKGRQTLLQAIAETHASTELSRFFAPEIAEKIARGEAGQGEEVEATVLYIDIRDFTALSERIGPAALIEMLSEYQTCMVPVIAEHNGTVERFTGDGVLASFGAEKRSSTYAADAMRAAWAILQAADEWSADRTARGVDPVRIGVALTTGRVIIGAVGGGGKFEYTLVGEPANRAAKIEKHNKLLGCRALADQMTIDLAGAQGWSGSLADSFPSTKVADVDNPVDLIALEPVDAAMARPELAES